MNLKMQAGITWSRPGNYCDNYNCVVLGLYDQFINHMASNRRFREPKAREILENAVPRSTRSVNKWAIKIFGEWQAGRTNKKACQEESGSAVETSQIQDLETKIFDMTAESLNFGLTKFIMEV